MTTTSLSLNQHSDERQTKQQLAIEKYRRLFDYSVSKAKLLPITNKRSTGQAKNNKHKCVKHAFPIEWNYTYEMVHLNGDHGQIIESPIKRRRI